VSYTHSKKVSKKRRSKEQRNQLSKKESSTRLLGGSCDEAKGRRGRRVMLDEESAGKNPGESRGWEGSPMYAKPGKGEEEEENRRSYTAFNRGVERKRGKDELQAYKSVTTTHPL